MLIYVHTGYLMSYLHDIKCFPADLDLHCFQLRVKIFLKVHSLVQWTSVHKHILISRIFYNTWLTSQVVHVVGSES